jgi:hypothetical protein
MDKVRSSESLLNALAGMVPVRLFSWMLMPHKEEMFQIDAGTSPLRLLLAKPSQERLDSMPKE